MEIRSRRRCRIRAGRASRQTAVAQSIEYRLGESNRASVRCGENARCSRGDAERFERCFHAAARLPNSSPASIPAQSTRGRRSFGKNPRPRKVISMGIGKGTVASAVLISSIFSAGTSPINFSVTCAPSMRTQRALRLQRPQFRHERRRWPHAHLPEYPARQKGARSQPFTPLLGCDA